MSGDVIDQLVGIEPGSALDVLRYRRPDAREYAQASYEALFCPENEEGVTLLERDVIAARVAELHNDAGAAAFYRERRDELLEGQIFGERLRVALEHAELLVTRPSEASPQALKALDDAGWSTSEIVTLSQLVAFLTFQIRLVAGLRSLAS